MEPLESKLLKEHMFRIDLDLAANCNRRCSFCPRSGSYPNINDYMSQDIVREIIERMREISFDGWVELAGRGEPALHPEYEQIISLLTVPDRTWKVRVTTNGFQLGKYWKYAYQKIDWLILNSYESQYEYDKRVEKYVKLANGNRVEHYYKPDGLAIEEINQMNKVPDTVELGKTWKYQFNNRAGWFSDKLAKMPCYHPIRQIFINYKGDYQMCCNDWTYQITIGNVLENNLWDMYLNNPKMQRIKWALLNGNRKDVLPCSMCDDSQGGRAAGAISRVKASSEYRYHLVKIASTEGTKFKEELRGSDYIPITLKD
jgi:organic radical activating enzyme